MAPKKGQTNNPHGRPPKPEGDKRTKYVRLTPSEMKDVKEKQKKDGNTDPLGKYMTNKTLRN